MTGAGWRRVSCEMLVLAIVIHRDWLACFVLIGLRVYVTRV